jgi:hypothetical protein
MNMEGVMKYWASLGLVLAGIALSGCATIVEGTTTDVALTTPPADGAKCELKNSAGTWNVTSPGTVKVHRSKDDLTVTCTKDGYQDGTVAITAVFNGATVGNVLAGGIIGIAVDAGTGADYGYPKTIAVPLVPTGTTPIPAAATVPAAPDAAPAADGKPTT